MNESPLATAASTEKPRILEAYGQVLPEITAFPQDRTRPINTDVPSAVTTILGAIAVIRSLRPRIVDELPKFDVERFDKLEVYALALNHAHTMYLTYQLPVAEASVLAERAAKMRALLLSDAIALSNRGLLDGARIDEIKPTTSHRQFAVDLLVLAQIFRASLKAIQGKTAVEVADIDRAVALADDLMVALGQRDQLGNGPNEAVVTRQKAFTLFYEAYRDARRAALYLELEDADDFVPQLYSGRGAANKGAEAQKPTPPASTEPAPIPVPTPVGDLAAVGMPNSSPFIS